MYTITLGREGPTDSCLCLNEKEFSIESVGCGILEAFWDICKQQMTEAGRENNVQNMLKVVYENHDKFDI